VRALHETPETRRLFTELVREGAAVARTRGVPPGEVVMARTLAMHAALLPLERAGRGMAPRFKPT